MDEIKKPAGKNILITGATGLIGKAIVDLLMGNDNINYDVYAMGRNSKRASAHFHQYKDNRHFHFIRHDVTDDLQSDVDFHYIIHAASNASPAFFSKHPVDIMRSNFEGTRRLLDYGKSHNMERFLYVSTGEVYGEGDGRIFTEDYQGYVNINSPRSCYPMAKRATETLCAAYAAQYNIDYVIARPCHTYGAYFTEEDNRVFAQFIRNVMNDEDIIMKSPGTQYRAWCSVEDCASAIIHILMRGKNGEAYNVADSRSCFTIRELAEMIAGIAGRKVIMDIPTEEEKNAFNPVTKSLFSTAKLEALGWKAKGDMRGDIQRIINTLRNTDRQ